MRDKALFYRIIIQWGIEHSAGPLPNLGSILSRLPDKGSLVGGTAGLAPVQKAQVQLPAASFYFAHPQPPPPPLPHFGLRRLKSKKLRPWRWRRGYSGDILLSGVSKKNRGLKTPQLRNENPTAFTPTKPLIKSLEGNSQKKKKEKKKKTNESSTVIQPKYKSCRKKRSSCVHVCVWDVCAAAQWSRGSTYQWCWARGQMPRGQAAHRLLLHLLPGAHESPPPPLMCHLLSQQSCSANFLHQVMLSRVQWNVYVL